MKRQTKKGPRRSRAMPVQSRSVVVTDYDGCSYITAGRKYAACRSGFGDLLLVIEGDAHIVSPDAAYGCAHLDDHSWAWATL